MYIETEMWENGDYFTPVEAFKCDYCGKYLNDSYPMKRLDDLDLHFCFDCAFKFGLISEKDYLTCSAVSLTNLHAGVYKGVIQLWQGNPIPPWKRSEKQQRNSSVYTRWREKVFERDDYTCQICGKRGGDLNAHHIKPFARYPELRTDLDNGITLCVDCHKKAHKKETDAYDRT